LYKTCNMGKIYLFSAIIFILFSFSKQVRYVWKTLNLFALGLIYGRKHVIKFLLISFFVYGNFAIAQISTVPFTTVGNSTWICPVGVTSITVQCRGGGGGGGGVNATVGAASGGGSGGSYSSSTVTVVPGTTYSITVGAGGTAGANTGGNGGAGGSSSFSLTSVVAVGGSGGTGASTAIGAAGGVGTTTGNTAGINFAGGDGAAGTVSSIGGGGGGGAGDANSGGNASGSTAGTGGVAGGGNGATGVSNVAGGTGSAIGGGGSGTRSTGTARAGGVGGRGQVNIIYTNPPVIVENFPNQTFCTTTYPTAYNTVNFSLIETAATNFDASQASQTIVLTLPAGFLFNLAAGPTVTRNTAAPGQDVTINGFSWTTTAITVTVTTAATQNNIDEINFNNFQIQATAASSGDLVRTGGTFKVNGSAAIPTSTQSFGHLATSAPSVYNSSAVSQYTTSNVIRGCSFTANPILEIRVNITGGNCTPADAITQFVFSTIGDAGSTNAATDISKAEIYYADTTQGFSNANFFGSVNNPNGTFTITGSQPLNLGSKTYYFYLTYIVPGTATIGNVLDASMSSFVFNGSTISNMSTPNPAGGRSIVSGTCLNAGDAAPPVTNTQTITAGSLIIPMDNTHQALVAPFNLKAYGLIHQLLLNDVPVKWVIKSGKAKDAPDFIANAGQIYPTVVAAASQTFIASEFVVDSFWVNHSFYPGGQTAAQVMTAFAVPNSVAVYSLTADVAVDVRYTLNHRPKIAVFSNGGNQAIQTTMLTAAGITSNVFVQNAGDFTGLASCYTFCSESHWDFSKNPDIRPVQRVMDFVREGGNFLAQCAGIDLYENHQPGGSHFQTTNGVSFANTTQTNTDYNADMAFCQYQGAVTSQGGTIASFWLPAGSVYKPEMFYGVSTPAVTNTVVASAAHLADPDSVGSNVFYLGGHAYAAGTIGNDNGIRMYLNATLVPAHRPTAFPIVMSSPTICAGQTVTIGPVPTVGANYVWSPATGLSSATVCNPIASPTTTSVYALTGFNGGCIMGPSTMTVNVNPTPATPTVSSNSPLCTGTTLSLTATASGTPTFNWSGPNSYTSTTQNPTIANVTSSISGSYSVTATSNSCTSLPGVVSVSVSAPPTTPTAGSNSPVCQGQTINLTASAVAGATYLWSGPNSYTSTSQNPSLTGILAAAGVYSVTATVAGCNSSIGTVTVIVNPTSTMTSASSATICGGVTVNIPLTSSVGGSTYTWLATDNVNTTGESTTSQTTNTLSNTIVNNTASIQTIIYTVTPTAAGCAGTSQTVTVTVNPVPVMTNTNSATICSAGTVNIPLTDNVGSTYTWIAADNLNTTGESTTLQTTNTLNNTIINNIVSAQNVIYSVTPTSISGGCLGTSQSITVTVNSTPSATASPSSQSICSNNVTAITLTSNVAGSTFAWTVSQTGVSGASASTGSLIAQTLTTTSTSTGSASYTITPTAGSCAGVPVVVNVTVTPIPSVTATPSSQIICSNNATAITLTSNIAGSTFAWTVNQTGISGASASTGSVIAQTLSTTGTTLGTAVYTITPSANSCNGAPIVVTVSVNPTPTITATPGTQTLCSGNASSISLTSNVAGTTFSWTVTQTNVTGASAASGASIAQTLSTTTTTSSGTAVYTITSSANSCGGSTQTVTVTVNPTPVMTSTNAGVICSAGTITIPLTSNVASGYTWIAADNVNTTGESTTLQSTNSINNTITNNTTSAQIVVYTVTPTSTAGSCVGAAQVVSVTVNPTPTMTSTNTAVVCSGSAFSINLTSNVASTYTWIATNNVNTVGESLTTQTATTLANTITNSTTSSQIVTYTVTPTTSAGNCAGVSQVINVTVNPTPVMTSTNAGAICSLGTITIPLTSNVASGYTWIAADNVNTTGESTTLQSTNSINNTITNNTTSAQIVVYTVTPTSTAGSCVGAAQVVSVTVNAIPTLTSATTATICSGGTVVLPLSSNVSANYSWIATDNLNTTGESLTAQSTATINNTIISSVGTTENVLYNVTPTSVAGSCLGATKTVTVTISPTPAVTLTPSSQVICSGSTASISLSSNVGGTTYSWTVSQSNTSGASAGTGTIISQALTATGLSAGIATYTVTPGIGTCSGSSSVGTITVNPIATVTATPGSQVLCSGNTTAINLSSNISGTTYSWTVSQTNVSGASASTGSVIAQNLTTTTFSQGTVTYTISSTNNGCSGIPVIVTVSVNPIPTLSITPSSQAFCTGSTTSLTLSSNVAGTTYSWTVSQTNASGGSASSGTLIAQTITATSASVGTVVYSVTPTAASCFGTPIVATVSVSPIPATPTPTNNGPICVNGSLNLSVGSIAGASYNWSGPNGFTSAAQNPTIASIPFAGAGVYTVNVTVNGCTGPNKTTTVVVNPPPPTTLTASSNSPLCSSQTLSLTVAPVAAATYSWAGPNSFSSTLQNPTITNASTLATGVYSITATVSGCGSSGTETLSVIVNQTPVAPIVTNNGPLCVGATLSLTASGAATTYSWTGPSGFTNNNQNPSITNIALVQAGVYSVSATTNGCTSAFGTTTVVVNPIPATPTISTNAPVCVGQTVNLTTGVVAGATYNWSGPNTYTSSIQNPTITNASTVQSGTYSLSVIVSGCTSATGTVGVAVNTAASSPTVSSNSPVCSGDTLFLSAVSSGGSIYSWSGPNGFTSTSQNPFIVNTTTLVSGTYTVIANNGCASTPAMVTATVNQTPATPTITSNSPVCSGNTLNLSATLLAGGNYNWSGPNGFTATTQNTSVSNMTPAEQGTYSVTVTKNGCTSLVAINNVTVTIPPIANAGLNTTVCANNATVALTGTVSGGSSTGIWTSTGSGTFTPNASLLNTSYIPSNADTTAGSVVLTLTSTNNGGCSASTSSITITITKAPVALAGSNATVCANNANVNLNGIVYGGSSTGIWTTSGTGTFNPNATTLNATYVPSVADITSGSITFTLTTTGNGQCFAASSQMTTTITTAPIVNAGPNQITCKATPNASLNGTVTVSNSGTWTTLGSGTFNPNATVLNPTYIPSSADTTAGSVLLVLTSSNNGSCLPVTDTVKISFSNIPTVNAGVSQTVCANNVMVSLNGSVTGGGTSGIWSSSGTGTFVPNATALNASYIPSGADTTARGVVLTLSSTNGCVVVSSSVAISISPAPYALAGLNISVCANNATANFNGVIGGATTTGIWSSSGSGTFSPTNTSLSGSYTASAADITAGSVFLILTSTNNGTCNSAIDTLLLAITPPPSVLTGTNTSFCANSSLALNGVVVGGNGTGSWSSSGTGSFAPSVNTLTATYIPSSADTTAHQVVLTLTSTNNGGCLAATNSLTVTITPAPIISAGVSQTICSNNGVVLLNGYVSIATGVQWTTLGNGSFTAPNSAVTSYSIGINDISSGHVTIFATTTGNGGCNAVSDTMRVQIQAAPIVNAGVDQFICKGIMTANLNGLISGVTTTGTWTTLGSGNFVSPTNLLTSYNLSNADTATGSVKLVLTSTNNGSCNSVSDTMLIKITPKGIAKLGNDTAVCANSNTITLSGSIFGGTGAGQWSTSGSGIFSPSNTSLIATYAPSVADINAGSVKIKLTPINTCLPTTDSLILTITPSPTVSAGLDVIICKGLSPINLSGSINTVPTGAIWSTNGVGVFSPASSTLITAYTPSVTDKDTIRFILTTTGNGLCNAVSDTMFVFRNIQAIANFTYANPCSGQSILFTDSSPVGSGTITSWAWNYGNGNVSTIQNPMYSYTSTGTYSVTLHINTTQGCSDSITKVINIHPSPVPNFSYTAGCLKDSVKFINNSSISSGTMNVWNWNYGDGTMGGIKNPAHLFDSLKVYNVSLTVTSDSGCVSTITHTITINPTPIAKFNIQSHCGSLLINLKDTSSVSSGSITNWNWTFGDGHVATTQNSSNTYSAIGVYTVTLQVQTNNGCKDTASVVVNLSSSILADYTPHGGAYHINEEIAFTNQSTGATSYVWSFGDGSSTTTATNPIHGFGSSGSYSVILMASNSLGCVDTVAYVFDVKTSGYTVPEGFTPNGDGINDGFFVLGGPFSGYELRVFNEWGNQIFISNSQTDKWDGTYKGSIQPAGTYVYIFNGKIVDGDDVKLKGEVNLIR
jgi:gliding motility-associated-like protein